MRMLLTTPLAQLTLHHWLNASQLAFHNHRHRKQGVGERGRREGKERGEGERGRREGKEGGEGGRGSCMPSVFAKF